MDVNTINMRLADGTPILSTSSGGVTVGATKALKLGNAYVNTPSVSTGYLLLTDSNGTIYEIPAKAH